MIVLFLAVALSACASTRHRSGDVIVDTKGVDMVAYERDLYEYRSYAEQVDVGEEAARGAVTGAVVGGAVGAVVNGSDGAERGAGVGAIGGGVRGAREASRERELVVKNCLRGRGYKVLN
jgi:outer membrane lipoprotein SlyB